jgi:hypothetical protein
MVISTVVNCEGLNQYQVARTVQYPAIDLSSQGAIRIQGRHLPPLNNIEGYRVLHLNINSLKVIETTKDMNVKGFFKREL